MLVTNHIGTKGDTDLDRLGQQQHESEYLIPKTILVTGAFSGFGRSICETLAGAGHVVCASMRDISGKNSLHDKALEERACALWSWTCPTHSL